MASVSGLWRSVHGAGEWSTSIIATMHALERAEQIRAHARTSARIAVLMTSVCALTLIGVAAEQVSEKRIGRLRSIGRELSESEIAQITDLANADGKALWLILGFRGMIPDVATVRVYLEPDVVTDRLRRGRILHLSADAPRGAQRSRWKVVNKASYAYVPLGGKPREITDERDLGWPFTIAGEIDDETLISLVTFVRSSPPIPGVPEGQAPREVVSAPLSGVWRQGDQFIVGLRLREDAEVFGVTVIKKTGSG